MAMEMVVVVVVVVLMTMATVAMVTVVVVVLVASAGAAPSLVLLHLLLAVDLEAALERVGAETADGRADDGGHEHPLVALPVAVVAAVVPALGRRVADVPRRQPAHDGAQDADAQARVG